MLEDFILISSAILVLIVIWRGLDWAQFARAYLLFFGVRAVLNTIISNFLVSLNYLEFPYRFLPHLTANNLIYDGFLLPGFTLLVLHYAIRLRMLWWGMGVYVVFLVVQDYFIMKHTELLVLHKWTLYHTAISGALNYGVNLFLFRWFIRWDRRK
ncbi:CBO0543 family protein [Ammoniphilus sp. CFH 90114]|uniref:CBO0543 family protein n=1 Tax=Ammoniphilus sp. CFH 90114 TaxID=2493665 RepID=UPI00100EA4FC|nr:CBO0543 family protein [Ammoniphilus sp. CFH 90114]RXT08008.1 hypothetical protein EIZ39_11380 [Ammoniphilus sp. CFH 90114]